MTVVYNDGEVQEAACNAAMVTQGLWRLTGGFPPETAVGAPDAALVSIMLANSPRAGEFVRIKGDAWKLTGKAVEELREKKYPALLK